ncbi:MAG: hypothetical protein ACRDP6_14745 [Actinoallomurus sp.]
MALSKEEQQMRDEARTALLTAIKDAAEKASERTVSHREVNGEALHHLAEAYSLLTGGPSATPKPAAAVGGFA